MYIKIGPYINRWSTNRFEMWWMTKRTGKYKFDIEDEDYTKLDNAIMKLCDVWQSVLNTTINQYLDRKQRKIKIKLDKYDTWSTDHTLSLIIVPMLKQLKETKHGAPIVDDEDVPENLRSTSAPPLTEEEQACCNPDDNFFKRWDWIMDEMIYTFEQIRDDWEPHSNSDEKWKRIQNGLRLFGKYYFGLWD